MGHLAGLYLPAYRRHIRLAYPAADACRAGVAAVFRINAWAACVTGIDSDAGYISQLSRDSELQKRFAKLLVDVPTFSDTATRFHRMWPIFKAQSIRRAGIRADQGLSRSEVVDYYLRLGLTEYAPTCTKDHMAAGEPVPMDWPHTLQAVYRVRCNLFHGEKSAHSEMDRRKVKIAFETLILFFRGAEIL